MAEKLHAILTLMHCMCLLASESIRYCGTDEQLDAAYQEVKDVVTVGRGLGLWGDMVVTLQNGDKVEIRSLPRCEMEILCSVLFRPTSCEVNTQSVYD